jgi:hypothetical protein
MTRPVSSLLPDPKWSVTRPFFEATAKEELRFPRCSNCGQFQWYPRILCRVCRSPEFTWERISPRGSVYTYTIVRRPMVRGAEGSVPFAVVQLRFDEAEGVILITNLADDDQLDRLAIDAPTSLVFHQVTQDVSLPYAVID